MLYFICFPAYGFVETKKGKCTRDVRCALPFISFKEADDFGRNMAKNKPYAILTNCTGV
jgi:hypothetical protein